MPYYFMFSHGTGALQKEMATFRHWSVSVRRDSDDVPHCRIVSSDKAEWRLIPTALCRWRHCFLADQLWFMTRMRETQAVRLGGRHNMPPPHLDVWPFDLEVGVGVACDLGYPCAKFRLPRPFGFRVRAYIRDIRQTDGRTLITA